MYTLLSLMIVSAVGAAPIDGRYPGAVQVYGCDFEPHSDDDFDGWPQGWLRRRGPGYPHYLVQKISREPSPQGEQCFRLQLDGGAAAVASPAQPFDIGSEYVVLAQMRTEGLRRDEAFVVLQFLNNDKQVVQSEFGPRVRSTDGWQHVRIGPVFCDHPAATSVLVELHLEPTDGHDLRGAAMFDDVWIGRLPRKNVRGKRPYNVFTAGEPVELSMTLTGLAIPKVRARLELFDRDERSVAVVEQTAAVDPAKPNDPLTVAWKPEVREPGFYQGKVTIYDGERVVQEDATALAIVEPLDTYRSPASIGGGEYGWSICDARHVPQLDQLHHLLYESGIRRLKYPVWYDPNDKATGEQVKSLIERLNIQGVGVIGTLTPAPTTADARFRSAEVSAAQTFRQDRSQWFPTIEHVLLDLAFKVRGWQLGDDRDWGFLSLSEAVQRIDAVKHEFDRIEQHTLLGVAWSWFFEPPQAAKPAWRYLALSATPDLTPEELTRYLSARKQAGVEQWLSLAALSRHEYSSADRTADLVERLMAAKIAGAEAVFFIDPFHSETGLLERNGAPSELYLPWRTITAVLDGSRPAGTLTLPGGSANRIFLRDEDAVIVLSHPTGTVETADFEGRLRFYDLWGREIVPRQTLEGPRIDVGPVPIIGLGLNRDCLAWDQLCRLEPAQLRESFGAAQPVALVVKNTFSQPLQGKLTLTPPAGWAIRPTVFDLSLAEGEEARLPFEVTLPVSVETGRELLQIDHDLAADRRLRFALFRELQVGDGAISLEIETRMVGDELEVEQRLVNNSQGNVSFRCHLFAPNQRRLRTDVVDLPPGIDVSRYRLPAGRELLGRTLLIRAEEFDGGRVLSRRFTVGVEQ